MQTGFFPVLALCLSAAPAAWAADRTVAVFDFELIDSSLQGEMMGEDPVERARLARMAPKLREDVEALAGFAVADTAPVRDKAARHNLQSCGNCALSFAREVGADIAMVGTVQKVSNLILNINAYAFDAQTGAAVARGSADIRSNSDESWDRGLQYLWENTLKGQLEAVN